jgi:hypothetical protein
MPRAATRLPRWLKHKALLTAEAVLLVALAVDHVSGLIKQSTLPGALKTLFVMLMTLGLFGALVLIIQGAVGRVIAAAFDAIPAVPNTILHVLAFAALAVLYARLNGFGLW